MRRYFWVYCYFVLLGLSLNTSAMTPMSDNAMSGVAGTGLAFALDDFRFMMRPTSYFEEVGVAPGAGAYFQRGDLRWYGLNLSSATGTGNGSQWNDTPGTSFGTTCDASSLGCARGGTIADFSPYDNPYMIRAYSPEGVGWDGSTINATPGDKTVYEYLAPTDQPYYKFSFWGELEVGRTGDTTGTPGGDVYLNQGTGSILKSQTMIQGNAEGSVFRMFNMTGDTSTYGNSAGEYALYYHSFLQGDFRFSTAQSATDTHDTSTVGSTIVGQPVVFDSTGGMYFKNVHAFLPFGQLYYQAITLKSLEDAYGNFGVFMPAIPNQATVYGDFYALRSDDNTAGTNGMGIGYETARLALLGSSAYIGFKTTSPSPNWAQQGDNSWKVTGYTNNTAYGYRTTTSAPVPYTANSTKTGHVNPNNCTFYEQGGTATPAACPQYGNPFYPTWVDPNNTAVTTWLNNNSGLKDYTQTHGYSTWGDWYPNCYDSDKSGCYGNATGPSGTRNAYNASNDGVYYQSCSSCGTMTAYARTMTEYALAAYGSTPQGGSYTYYTGGNVTGTGANAVIKSSVINLGDARITGMLINKMTLTSCLQSTGGAC
jgi:hypothetical protein